MVYVCAPSSTPPFRLKLAYHNIYIYDNVICKRYHTLCIMSALCSLHDLTQTSCTVPTMAVGRSAEKNNITCSFFSHTPTNIYRTYNIHAMQCTIFSHDVHCMVHALPDPPVPLNLHRKELWQAFVMPCLFRLSLLMKLYCIVIHG